MMRWFVTLESLHKHYTSDSQKNHKRNAHRIPSLAIQEKLRAYPPSVVRYTDVDPRVFLLATAISKASNP